jgi:phage baseplate assembly protein gpV
MAKSFYTTGTGDEQTLTPIINEKVPIYDTIADAESDLANLEVGQIVKTKDAGLVANLNPIDEVKQGVFLPPTSNAVAGACVRFPDYARNLYTTAATSFTMQEDGYITYTFFGSVALLINNINVSTTDNNGSSNVTTFQGYAKKGDIITQSSGGAMVTNLLKIFALK